MTGDPKPKVVVITGPTAVGKTELSLSLAERLQGEIISADSVQVYRGLDVGSAKVSIMNQGWLEPVRSSATLASISANDCDPTWQPRIHSVRCRPMGQYRLSASEWIGISAKGSVGIQSSACLQIPLEERRGITHHLLDILDPNEDFSAGEFFQRSRTAINDILEVYSALERSCIPAGKPHCHSE